jgi:hypothetical protein
LKCWKKKKETKEDNNTFGSGREEGIPGGRNTSFSLAQLLFIIIALAP